MSDSPSTSSLSLGNSVAGSRLARRWLQGLLGTGVSKAMMQDTLLLTSELVSNATLHTRDGCRVTLTLDPNRPFIRIEVSDESRELPQPVRPAIDGKGGHGLQLVNAVASKWGTRIDAHGKTVWFELSAAPTEIHRRLRTM